MSQCLTGAQVTFHGANDKGKQTKQVDVCTAIASSGSGTGMETGCYNLNDPLFSTSSGAPLFKKGQGCFVSSVDVPAGVHVSAWHLDGTWGDHDCSTQSWAGHGRSRSELVTGPATMKPPSASCAFRIQAENGYSCSPDACAKKDAPTASPASSSSSSSSECVLQ
jgi:hypothetical protein